MSGGSTDAFSLAVRLEADVRQVLDRVDVLLDWVWNAGVEVEEKSVASLLHHIGWALEDEAAEFQKIARGEEIDS